MYPNENEVPSAQEQHDAVWQPILAAHRVAAALRTIADALPHLSAQAREVLVGATPVKRNGNDLAFLAECLTATAPLPIEPTDEDREAQFDRFYEAQCDAHPKDTAHAWLDTMTEAERAEEIAQAALDDLLDSQED